MESSIKTASKIMATMGVYLLCISILWIFLTEIMFVSDVYAYTGWPYQNYLAVFPVFASFYMITKKLIGIVLCAVSILFILINEKCFSEGEKWSWYALLITGTIIWGSLLGYRIVIRYFGPSIVIFIIGTTLFIIGIVLPAKEFLEKTS